MTEDREGELLWDCILNILAVLNQQHTEQANPGHSGICRPCLSRDWAGHTHIYDSFSLNSGDSSEPKGRLSWNK